MKDVIITGATGMIGAEVIITGATGMIGSAVTKTYAGKGVKCNCNNKTHVRES